MKTLVIGIGNRMRGDDAAGLRVIERLAVESTTAMECLALEHIALELYEAWRDRDAVLVVDAATSGHDPGTVHRFDARVEALPVRISRFSSHGFGLHEAIELARALDRLPSRLIVYTIEGESFIDGAALSPPVEEATRRLAERIREEIQPAGA